MSHTCRSAFELYGQVWAALVTIDRQTRDREKRRGLMGEMLTNGLEDQPRTLAALGRIIGRGWRATPWEPFVLRVIREYRNRRELSQHPLRIKSSVPAIHSAPCRAAEDPVARRGGQRPALPRRGQLCGQGDVYARG